MTCQKFQTKVIFFLILIFIATINIYYQYIINIKSDIKPSIIRKFNNIHNISLKSKQLVRDFTKKYDSLKEFNTVVDKFCNSKVKVLDMLTCLEKLSELDKTIAMLDEKRNDCDKCIRLNNRNFTIFYHTFWQINELKSEISTFYQRTIFLNLMSYLATQNLCCTKFIFWKLKEFPDKIDRRIKKTFKYFIDNNKLEIKSFNLEELCGIENFSFKRSFICSQDIHQSLANQHLISLSDLVRFVVLDAYGGIYTDGDVIYLKDMSLLWQSNFAYRWSYTDNYNTAVLGVNKMFDSSISQVYNRIISSNKNINSLINSFHPLSLSNTVRNLNKNSIYDYGPLRTFHSYLFDPAWTCFDGVTKRLKPEFVCGFDEFNNKKMLDEVNFNPKIHPSGGGSFTYHLHLINCGSNVRNDSYFKYFENYYYSTLNQHISEI